AHALPCTFNGSMIGAIGDVTVFSFYVTKTLATGEGGMVTTNSEEMAQRIKTMRLHGNRDEFIENMAKKGIGTSVHFIPLHLHPYWRDRYQFKPDDFPVALDCFQRAVSLPIYSKMTDEDVERVVEAVKEILNYEFKAE
ncbi:MAG: DegT/DnrJ/EryC1/StrS family aminotransferase, partial [Pseudomonadota bacterium]